MTQDVILVLVTCPTDQAENLAAALVEARVAACVNVIPALQSIYRWQGAVQRDREALLLAKTTRDRFDAFKAAVLARHPYDLPEIVAVGVDHGHAPYLAWVVESTR